MSGMSGKISSILYNRQPLIDAIKRAEKGIAYTYQGVTLPQNLRTIIDEILYQIANLLHTDNHKKLYLADKLFKHLHFDTAIPNPIFRHSVYRTILEHIICWEKSHEHLFRRSEK